uniref:NADH dehydrogenase subunit 2 n=1 Tax=Ibla cumingi TaxID=58185 RepID=UPI0021CC8E42|nr:NADH dehydrogenase subunit 2 [Ibla cumingi]UWM12934.1 NADH dehydrogenase subunit 2 [Ibla cumingi]
MLIFFPPFIYLFSLILGTFISVSSSSWFSAWLGLEINLLSFIPIIINLENNSMSSEAAVKYFLIQAIASSLIIFSSLTFISQSNHIIDNFFQPLIICSLAMKMGMAPFHFWFPEVMEGLSWINGLILLTWQKFAPLFLLSFFLGSSILIIFGMTSVTFGAFLGLNQTSLRKILCYSSISHLGWLASFIYFDSFMWVSYYAIYCLISFIIVVSMQLLNVNYFNQLLNLSTEQKIIMSLNMFSLGGLPPLMGFLPKWIALDSLSSNSPILAMLIISSLVTLYFYARICFSTFALVQPMMSWTTQNPQSSDSTILYILTSISVLGPIPLTFILY